jgi:hypothetical protein
MDLQHLRLLPVTGLLYRFDSSDKRRNFFRIDARHNFAAILLQAFDDIVVLRLSAIQTHEPRREW